jgi:hypothetical protein
MTLGDVVRADQFAKAGGAVAVRLVEGEGAKKGEAQETLHQDHILCWPLSGSMVTSGF